MIKVVIVMVIKLIIEIEERVWRVQGHMEKLKASHEDLGLVHAFES